MHTQSIDRSGREGGTHSLQITERPDLIVDRLSNNTMPLQSRSLWLLIVSQILCRLGLAQPATCLMHSFMDYVKSTGNLIFPYKRLMRWVVSRTGDGGRELPIKILSLTKIVWRNPICNKNADIHTDITVYKFVPISGIATISGEL